MLNARQSRNYKVAASHTRYAEVDCREAADGRRADRRRNGGGGGRLDPDLELFVRRSLAPSTRYEWNIARNRIGDRKADDEEYALLPVIDEKTR